jgi:DUF1680 family protein
VHSRHAVRPSASALIQAVQPASIAEVTDPFWVERQRINRDASLSAAAQRLEESGAFPYLRAAAGGPPPVAAPVNDPHLLKILDSDAFKWLEAVAYDALHGPLPSGLAATASGIIDVIVASQHPDGALNSWATVHGVAPLEQWVDGHELYCGGHLIQAAVAWSRAVDDDRLLGAAVRFADFAATAAEADPQLLSVHPGLEMALVELFRETGERRFLEFARDQIDRRGHGLIPSWRFSPDHFVDRVPVREQGEILGHAVMSLFLLCGMVDVAVETGDRALLDAARAQWADMADHKLYLTGGVGSRNFDEAFGEGYELASDTGYAETCAAVASMMLSWRLLLATGEARYAELIERTMYNAMLAGVALDGEGYLYSSPLHVRRPGGILSPDGYTHRMPWFQCACCPPNAMRAITTAGQLVATTADDGIQVHQYIGGRFGAPGRVVELSGDLPFGDGSLQVTIGETDGTAWSVRIRRAGWFADLHIDTSWDGGGAPSADEDWLVFDRTWEVGDRITLATRLVPVRIEAHPHADMLRSQIAFQRGPIVLAAEEPGVPGADIERLRLPAGTTTPTPVPGDLGVTEYALELVEVDDGGPLYRVSSGTSTEAPGTPVAARLLPYFAWGNRGACRMKVWLPTA